MNPLSEKIFSAIKEKMGSEHVQIPPPAVVPLEPEIMDFQPGKSIKMNFPIKPDYNNPFGITFGGYMGMFFDATFGPFSGLVTQKPTTSLDINITFLKPLSPADKIVTIEATVISQSKSYLNLYGKAVSGKGVLAATCTSRMLILNR